MQMLVTRGLFDAYSASQCWDCIEEVNRPVYTDTDNMIFVVYDCKIIENAIERHKLAPAPLIGEWIKEGSFVRFTIEFERWHDCKVNLERPLISNGIFLGKKSYIMTCVDCDAVRLKAKGHNKQGIDCATLATILRTNCPKETTFMCTNSDNSMRLSCLRYFSNVYGEMNERTLENINSGERVSFRIKLATGGSNEFTIEPGHIRRTYISVLSPNLTRCPLCLVTLNKV
jgi:hypothetical protein